MADSSRTPLIRQRSSQSAAGRSSQSGAGAGDDQPAQTLFGRLKHGFTSILTMQNFSIASGPLATLCIFLFAKYHGFDDGSEDKKTASKKIGAMLGALMWMAMWWILESVPIAITSLLPLVLFPFFEVMDSEDVAREYMNDIVVLMLGTFILALAINRYNLHKRMALKILLVTGGERMNPRLVLLGFIVGPAFISMWMANTSAAAMMIPMATGLLQNLEPAHHVDFRSLSRKSMSLRHAEDGQAGAKEVKNDRKRSEISDEELDEIHAKEAIRKFSQGVILGVTYGVALGGMGTLIGCGPDLVLPGIYSGRFPGAPEVTFLLWMKFAMPFVIIWIIAMWLFLSWMYCPPSAVPVIEASLNRNMVEKAYEVLGPISFAEVFIFTEFCLLVVLWITRSFGETPGWGILFDNFPNDGTSSILASILLFVVPNFKKKGEMLMDWKACKDISWSVILLLGAGFALSTGILNSGVSTWIGLNMQIFKEMPHYMLIPVLSLLLSVITEFSSNVAVATLFLPICAELAVSVDVHPLFLMIPVAFVSSFAFVLPSGTPPTAIAFGTGYVTVRDMGSPGLFMHISGLVLISLLTPTLGNWVYGVNTPASSLPWIS